MDSSTTPAPAGRRAGPMRWGLRLGAALAVGALLWSAAWFYAPPLIAAQAEQAVLQQLGRRLTLGKVEFRPWSLELTISDLAIAGPGDGAPPLLQVGRVRVDAALASVLQFAPVIDALEVEAPMLRVARVGQGRYDIDDILRKLAAAPAPTGSEAPARFALHNIVLRGGGIDFDDRPVATVHRVRDLGVGLPFISSLPSAREIQVQPHLGFVLDGSRFETAATATPYADRGNGELRLKFAGFDIQPLLGYMPSGLPVQLRTATLAADLKLAFEQRPKLSLNITGSIGAAGIEIVDAASQPLLRAGSLKLQVEALRPLERLVRLQRVEIQAPQLFAARDAKGQVNLLRAGAPAAGTAMATSPAQWPAATQASGPPPPSATASALASAPASAPASATTPGTAPPPAAADGWRASVAALSVQAGRLSWRDATTAPAASLAIDEFSLEAQALHWPTTAPVVFKGEGQVGDGADRGRLSFSGQGNEQGADVRILLTELPLKPLQPYLRHVLAQPLAGVLSADMAVHWKPGSGGPVIQLDAKRLALARATLGPPGAPELGADLVEMADVRVDTATPSATLGRLLLRAPRVRVERDAARHWGFERWTAAPGATAAAAPQATRSVASAPTTVQAAPTWKLALGELGIERGRIAFNDQAGARPVAVDIADLNVRLRDWALQRAAPAPFQISARVMPPSGSKARGSGAGAEPGGKVELRGELSRIAAGVPGGAQATLLLQDLPLHLLDPYLDDIVNVRVRKAQASYKGTVRWEQREAGASIGLRGDATVEDFRAVTEGSAPQRALRMVSEAGSAPAGRELLNWKSLSLRGIDVRLAPGTATSVSVDQTTLSDFFARVVLDENGKLNLQDVARTAPAAAGAASGAASAAASGTTSGSTSGTTSAAAPGTAPDGAAAGQAPVIQFGPIAVVNGRLAYNDRFIKPNYNANLSELTGRLGAFSSVPPSRGAPPRLADLSLQGRVEGTATLDISGQVNPLAQPLALDVQAKVRDLELPPLSPYAIKYAGHGIQRGKLNVDLAYRVQPDGQLTASNKIVLHQLDFGEKAEGSAASLPVKLAVALLSDRNGVIDLDLPVSGSINDPQFSIGGILWKVVTNLVVKAVTAPFALLASAFGGSDSEASSVEFDAGKADLTPAAQQTLDKLAKALAERPAVSLTVTGTSRLDRERDAWKAERLQQIVRAEKRRRHLAGGGEAGSPISVAPDEYPALLKEVYLRADIVKPRNLVGQPKDLPVPEMEALLLSAMTVADDAMQQLAVRRGVAVRDYLAGREIAMSRLFLGAPKVAGDEASWRPHAELKLAAP